MPSQVARCALRVASAGWYSLTAATLVDGKGSPETFMSDTSSALARSSVARCVRFIGGACQRHHRQPAPKLRSETRCSQTRLAHAAPTKPGPSETDAHAAPIKPGPDENRHARCADQP